jgi:hypothetical protein
LPGRRHQKFIPTATSQPLKKRVAGHLQDTCKLLKDGVRSSTLASHLAQMWQQNSNLTPSAGMLRDELTYSILWQGDPFSCSKTFGTPACKLCQKERVALLQHSWSDGANMLIDRSEIHGSCRRTARFIGYACGPVLMIPPRVKGLCFVSVNLFGQAAGCGLSPASGCRVPALDVGLNI